MRKRDMQIFAPLDADIRKHPEILLTSGLSTCDDFNGPKCHIPMLYCYVIFVIKFWRSKSPNS